MKSVHLVIPDLFLPKDFAAEVCAGLHLPALRKLLARGHSEMLEAAPLENRLCELFDVRHRGDAPVAPLAAAFDGLLQQQAGAWLCATPAHLRLQRDQMLLLDCDDIGGDEAVQFCRSLNEYFSGQGMTFHAPHPLRWYLALERLPDICCVPLSQASGRNIRGMLPGGTDAARWHQIFNEIQMLLFAHPLNDAREARGALPVNSLWLWGGGLAGGDVAPSCDCVATDELLAEMFAASAGISCAAWSERWHPESGCDRQLLVWTNLRRALRAGDLEAWRSALQRFESGYAAPLWQALRSGQIERLQIEVLSADGIRRVSLTRGDTWAFWRRGKTLAEYSVV